MGGLPAANNNHPLLCPVDGPIRALLKPIRALSGPNKALIRPSWSKSPLILCDVWPKRAPKGGPEATKQQAQGPKLGFRLGGTPILQKSPKTYKNKTVETAHSSRISGPFRQKHKKERRPNAKHDPSRNKLRIKSGWGASPPRSTAKDGANHLSCLTFRHVFYFLCLWTSIISPGGPFRAPGNGF